VRFSLILTAAAVWGQTFDATPAVVHQGETLQVRGGPGAAAARMNGRTIPLFTQADGGSLGLMPVPALEHPGAYELEWVDKGGQTLHTQTVTVRDANFPKQNIRVGPSISGLKPSPGEMQTVAAFRKGISDLRHWDEPLALPVSGCMTSRYGVQRLHNGKPTGNYHSGIDQRGAAGVPIRAVADGVARVVQMFNIHGGTVGLDHGQGLSSIYLHMSKFAVEEGATVKKGDVIGYVGSTGRSTAPHLHWSLYANGVPVNPAQWVKLKPCPAPKRSTGKRAPAPRR
jgi:murein DD-endopeptidase MepM/ murein hydrolase activator NlpD